MYIQAFDQFQFFSDFEYFIFDELPYNFSTFYELKQSLIFSRIYKTSYLVTFSPLCVDACKSNQNKLAWNELTR